MATSSRINKAVVTGAISREVKGVHGLNGNSPKDLRVGGHGTSSKADTNRVVSSSSHGDNSRDNSRCRLVDSSR